MPSFIDLTGHSYGVDFLVVQRETIEETCHDGERQEKEKGWQGQGSQEVIHGLLKWPGWRLLWRLVVWIRSLFRRK